MEIAALHQHPTVETSALDELINRFYQYVNEWTIQNTLELHKYVFDFAYDNAKYVLAGVITRSQIEEIFDKCLFTEFKDSGCFDSDDVILAQRDKYRIDLRDGLRLGLQRAKRDQELKSKRQNGYAKERDAVKREEDAQGKKINFLAGTARHKKVRDEVEFNRLRNECWLQQENKAPKLLHIRTAEAVRDYRNVRYYNDGSRDGCYIEYDDDSALWKDITADTVNRYIDTFIGETSTDSLTRSVRQKLRAHAEIPLIKINRYPDLIPLGNCSYNLNSYTAEERTEKQYWTYATEYHYDANARCPTIDENLWLYSCGDQAWIDAFWEMAGYCMTGDATFQVMFWVIGSGGNGKGTCDRIIQSLVGTGFTQSIKPDMLSNQFYLQYLINKRLGVISDLAITLDNIHIIKQLTGGDKMQTNLKFKNQDIQFVNECKLFFAMNKMPYIETSNIGAMKRRIQMFPFDYRITNRDPAIERQMMSELPGAFNRAIEGLQRLRKNRNFTRIKRGDTLVDIWLGEMNTFAVWFNDSIVPDPAGTLTYDEAWEDYSKYMRHYTGKSDWDRDRGNVSTKHGLVRKIKENVGMLQERIIHVNGADIPVRDKHTGAPGSMNNISITIEAYNGKRKVFNEKSGAYEETRGTYSRFRGIRLRNEAERDAQMRAVDEMNAQQKELPYNGYNPQAGF